MRAATRAKLGRARAAVETALADMREAKAQVEEKARIEAVLKATEHMSPQEELDYIMSLRTPEEKDWAARHDAWRATLTLDELQAELESYMIGNSDAPKRTTAARPRTTPTGRFERGPWGKGWPLGQG